MMASVLIQRADGPDTLHGVALPMTSPGLAVHSAVDRPGPSVTHTRRGAIIGWAPTRAACLELAERLASVADWRSAMPQSRAGDILTACAEQKLAVVISHLELKPGVKARGAIVALARHHRAVPGFMRRWWPEVSDG